MEAMNVNRVPAKVWRKWTPKARVVFNRVYGFMMENPSVMVHPKQEKIRPQCWKTIAWNCAWISADAVDDSMPQRVEVA